MLTGHICVLSPRNAMNRYRNGRFCRLGDRVLLDLLSIELRHFRYVEDVVSKCMGRSALAWWGVLWYRVRKSGEGLSSRTGLSQNTSSDDPKTTGGFSAARFAFRNRLLYR